MDGSDLLLDPTMWPTPLSGAGFGAMRVLAATGPQHEILRTIGNVQDPRVYRPVRKEFEAALSSLKALDSTDRIGVGYGGNAASLSAIAALRDLVAALEAEGEDCGVQLPPLREYLADPPLLQADLRRAIADFLEFHIAGDLARLATFSLILFREEDLEGAISTSLVEDRSQWRDALSPQDGGRDLHLAVVPPPTASAAVLALAAELKCSRLLPCVVFLGDKPDRSLRGETLLTRLSARSLQAPPPAIPDQLRTIYRTVYRGPRGGGLWMATGDKCVQLALDRANPRVVLGLLVGALGGPTCVAALNTALQVFTK